MVNFNELFERYKQLIGLSNQNLTEEQLAEFENIRRQIEAEGGETGEAAPITGTDIADIATSFGGGGVVRRGTTVTKDVLEGVGKETIELIAEGASKTITKQGTKIIPQGIMDDLYKTVVKGTKKTVQKFPSNPRSLSLSQKLLIGAGFSTAAAGALMPIIGTYPFTGFIKEESFQTIDFAIKAARENGDKEGEAEALAFKREMLDVTAWENVIGKIPFANVMQELKTNTGAAIIKLDIDETDFNKRAEEEEFAVGASRKELLERQLEEAKTIDERARILKDLSFIKDDEEIKRDKFERQDLEEFRNKQEQQQEAKEADIARRQKDSASVGTRGLTQAQPERKAREIPSKLKFGL